MTDDAVAVAMLLRFHANPALRNADGQTPSEVTGSDEVASLLVDRSVGTIAEQAAHIKGADTHDELVVHDVETQPADSSAALSIVGTQLQCSTGRLSRFKIAHVELSAAGILTVRQNGQDIAMDLKRSDTVVGVPKATRTTRAFCVQVDGAADHIVVSGAHLGSLNVAFEQRGYFGSHPLFRAVDGGEPGLFKTSKMWILLDKYTEAEAQKGMCNAMIVAEDGAVRMPLDTQTWQVWIDGKWQEQSITLKVIDAARKYSYVIDTGSAAEQQNWLGALKLVAGSSAVNAAAAYREYTFSISLDGTGLQSFTVTHRGAKDVHSKLKAAGAVGELPFPGKKMDVIKDFTHDESNWSRRATQMEQYYQALFRVEGALSHSVFKSMMGFDLTDLAERHGGVAAKV